MSVAQARGLGTRSLDLLEDTGKIVGRRAQVFGMAACDVFAVMIMTPYGGTCSGESRSCVQL